jgi:hypothetical protein
MPRPLSTPGKDPISIVQEAGWAPGPVWTGAENLAPTGIPSLDRPARRQPLYQLSYRAHNSFFSLFQKYNSKQNVPILLSSKLLTVDDLLRIFPAKNKSWNTINHPTT